MNDQFAKVVGAQDEEDWYALLQHARHLRDSGDEEEFVKAALDAFRRRPNRAEPLLDLARHYFGKSHGDLSAVYADAGLSLPVPDVDRLGVDPEVYRTGLKEMFTIAASYSKDFNEKERGRAICNWLAIGRDVPQRVRDVARRNYHWYTESAKSLMPSIEFFPITTDAPDGFKPGNISVTRARDGLVALIRAVNYDQLENGYFDRHGDTSFRQRTLLVNLDENLQVTSSVEVFPPDNLPPPKHVESIGLEDPRPILWRGDLWSISSVRQLNSEGRAEMVLGRVAKDPSGNHALADWRVLTSGMPVQWEKNWMPQVAGDELRFIYSLDPTRILSESGDVLGLEEPVVAAENIRGGSQAIPFDGGWLMVVHEWQVQHNRRYYYHRFVWFDENNRLTRFSRRFYLQRIAGEFVAGLAWHVTGDRLVVSFGTDDREPTLAVVEAQDVRATLLDTDEHWNACVQACEVGRNAWNALTLPGSPSEPECGTHRASDAAPMKPARVFTTFGTVLYWDTASGALRHGEIHDSPENVVLVPSMPSALDHRLGRLIYEHTCERTFLNVTPDGHRVILPIDATDSSATAMDLEIVPLERGLVGLKFKSRFLCAEPDGRIDGSRSLCSTWECFFVTEDWCATRPAITDDKIESAIDTTRIARFTIDPRFRVKVNAKSSATKVLIYGYPHWSHGRVYYDLCKHLCQRGYVVDILNWQANHADYFHELTNFYDYFMSALDGIRTLTDAYQVPHEKLIAISHHELDIRMLIEQKGIDVFEKFAGFGVVSHSVYSSAMMQGIRRPPKVASLGINFDEFYSEPSERLETVGYASSMSATTYGVEWKRGHLAEAAAREAGLAFKVAGSTGNQVSFHDMPDFYRSVDAVLMTSISESGPLTVMEAAAAGRLVIGTPVGHFPVKAYQGGGIIAPIESEKFTTFAAGTLKYFKDNPSAYIDKCHSIQDAARTFDWKYVIDEWIELIESARRYSSAILGN